MSPKLVQKLEAGHFNFNSMLGKIFSRQHIQKYYFYFSQKTGFDISCKLPPIETICMKCQSLFSVENNKNKYYQFVIF